MSSVTSDFEYFTFTQLFFASFARAGKASSDVRVYIDGDCEYLVGGASAYYSFPITTSPLATVSVILHVLRGCSGVMYVLDAENNAVLLSMPVTLDRGVHLFTLYMYSPSI